MCLAWPLRWALMRLILCLSGNNPGIGSSNLLYTLSSSSQLWVSVLAARCTIPLAFFNHLWRFCLWSG